MFSINARVTLAPTLRDDGTCDEVAIITNVHEFLNCISLCQQGALYQFLTKFPLTFSNKAAIIRSRLLAYRVVRELNTVVSVCSLSLTWPSFFVPKIQQPFHKWIFDPLSKKEERERRPCLSGWQQGNSGMRCQRRPQDEQRESQPLRILAPEWR